MTLPNEEVLERQVEDMFGRPTGPRHEELGARPHVQEGAPRQAGEEHREEPREPEEGGRSQLESAEEQAKCCSQPPY